MNNPKDEIYQKFPVIGDLLAFNDISNEIAKDISRSCKSYHFSIGDYLCRKNIIPSEILIISEGEARLIGEDQGKIITLEKLGPGSFIGLASFLRAAPCEEIIASSELKAITFPDRLILKLLQEKKGFFKWCTSTIFTAELAKLVSLEFSNYPLNGFSLRNVIEGLRLQTYLIPYGRQDNAINQNQKIIVASQNIPDNPIGTKILPGGRIPNASPPLPPRIIAINNPKSFEFANTFDQDKSNKVKDNLLTQKMRSVPLATGIDLGQSDKNQIKLIRAKGNFQEAMACFQMLSKVLDLPFRRDAIEKVLRKALQSNKDINLKLCGDISLMMGLHVNKIHAPASLGKRLETPSLLKWREGFAVVSSSNANGLILASPRDGWISLDTEEIEKIFPDGIEMLLLEKKSTTPQSKFGISWFWPVLRRHRTVLFQVLLASFVVQLFSLANPLLIQVVIDKVINQRSLETLQVLGLALVVITFMEGFISSLRTFLFSETTNRIDMRLGSEVVDHLMRLPSNYFDKRPVGELGTRVAELEKIRNFLTGQTLSTLLDTCFSVIYIVVMLFYSWLLTFFALCVLPIQVAITLIGTPLFRRKHREAAHENAKAQSCLNEALTGINTVKAQNIELKTRWKWQEIYKRYVSKSFSKNITGTILIQSSQILQKLSQILILWVGAGLVLNGKLSLGQLIAFRIISGYVTQPLLRLSNTWQSIQELKVSLERIGDVIDTPQESNDLDKRKIPLPLIQGDVKYENVSFTFEASTRKSISDINLHIEPGTFVGVVGRSGSGKSTFTKMLARLYSPNDGRILIDNYDISKVELYSLRSQIGIVPQDTFLFRGTVAENITFDNADVSNEEIIKACKIACAHDFIMDLPDGYSSLISERGANLSGGQRQRIALARTLISKPRLLILDEATSSLDYQTEHMVCKNLINEVENTTVFFVTHRLQTIKDADLILYMEDGNILEKGTHVNLLKNHRGYFSLINQTELNV